MESSVHAEGVIKGHIKNNSLLLRGRLSSRTILRCKISKPELFNNDPYEGSYEVTPRVYAQTLDTRDKLMTDNLVIKEIPCAEVDNLYGGTTVIIGGE